MIQLLTGDCRAVLPTLPANSVHCVVTSPPYYGLRDYGTAQWEGGDAACDHLQRSGQRQDVGRNHVDGFNGPVSTGLSEKAYRDICGKCGARRIDAQIGLEATPADFIAEMVAVFRLLRRVLRDDGTVWLNLGDSYSGYHGNKNSVIPTSSTNGWVNGYDENQRATSVGIGGIKPKDLLLMPARVALALQADGWWVRSDIIWAKPNPMPESCRDRPTSAHEHVFLLSKRARYFYDADAVREEHQDANVVGGVYTGGGVGAHILGQGWNGKGGHVTRHREYNPAGRNLRNVWEIATHPYSAAHFATFPPTLAERCIRPARRSAAAARPAAHRGCG